MPLIISVPEPSAGTQACQSVARSYGDIANYLGQRLTEIVVILNDPVVAREFWTLQGTGGVAALVAFAKARELLREIAPDLVSSELTAAGSTLVANPDGTVTVPE